MKKNLFVLAAALLLGSGSLFAQEQGKRIKEEGKVEFAPHWFMQIQAGAAHTIGEAKFSDLVTPAAALNFGYQFNPLFSLRAGASGWKGKGKWGPNPTGTYKYNYVQGNLDAMLNLSNLFCKYNPTRTLNIYSFLGVGFNHAFDNNEAVALADQGADLEYLWRDSKNSFAGRGGLGLDIRLSDHVSFNVEANANVLSDKFNSKKAGNADWQFNALAGLTIKFGKGYTKTEPVYYEATPVPIAKPEPKPEVKPVAIVSKVEAMTQNIFFDLDKSDLREDQKQKVADLVSYLRNHPNAKITITGYADKETGNAKYNAKLSEKRAETIKAILLDKEIEESRIVTDYKGDSIQPFSENDENRVTICVAE